MGRLGHTLSTLRPYSRLQGRKTRFRLLARLFRVGSLSHWVPRKVSFDASYIAFLPSQAYPGASALRSDKTVRQDRSRFGRLVWEHRVPGAKPSERPRLRYDASATTITHNAPRL